jgi:hypothetical protein
MATPLFGDPYNLQGSSQSLQGGYNPQGFVGPVLQGPAPQTQVTQTQPAPTVAPKTTSTTTQPKATTTKQPVSTGVDLSGKYGLAGSTVYRKSDNYAFSSQDEFFRETGLSSWNGVKLDTAYQPGATPSPSAASQAQPSDPNQQLAQAAAQAGLSVDDYLKLISNQYAVTPEEKAQINQELGITDLENQVFTPPSKTTEQMYQDAFNQAGLGDIKKRFEDVQKQINEKKQQLNERLNTINENPWKSEATRIGAINREKEFFEGAIANLEAEANQYAELYNQGLTEVGNLISRVTADFDSNRNMNLQKLQYLQSKAEERLQTLASQKASKVYQYLPDYLNAKIKATKPDTIGSKEAGFYAWDTSTGTFVQIIKPQLDLTDDQKEYAMYLQQGGKGSFVDFKREMANLKARASGSGIGTELSNTMKMLQIQLLTQQLTGTKPLSGEAAKLKGIADTVVPELSKLKQQFEQDYKGSVRGIVVGTNRELSKLVDNIADKIGRLRSGGAINKDEEKRFKGQIASWKDLAFGNKNEALLALDGIMAEALTVQKGISPYQNQGSNDPSAIAALLGGVQIK